ncbi:hypothetical protein Cni_G09085 [Canna indica]|uniref:DUF4283 domain-containing protein n=1 Tax=Canna indica TaxID=4628 RepID=A0AAQ3K208_9LILI|nr:hypothetical protein Cni_G09085 [Canna indica]
MGSSMATTSSLKGILLPRKKKPPDRVIEQESSTHNVEKPSQKGLNGEDVGKAKDRSCGRSLNSWATLFRRSDLNSNWMESKEMTEKINKIHSSAKGKVMIGEDDLNEVRRGNDLMLYKKIEVIPVWIQLPGIPYEYLSSNILPQVVAIIGKPLKNDSYTQNGVRGKFARVQRRKRAPLNHKKNRSIISNPFKILNNLAFEEDGRFTLNVENKQDNRMLLNEKKTLDNMEVDKENGNKRSVKSYVMEKKFQYVGKKGKTNAEVLVEDKNGNKNMEVEESFTFKAENNKELQIGEK